MSTWRLTRPSGGYTIVLTAEHRATPELNGIEIELTDDGKGPACGPKTSSSSATIYEVERKHIAALHYRHRDTT